MFHEFGMASDDLTAIMGFVQIIQEVSGNKCGAHAHTQRTCDLVFFLYMKDSKKTEIFV